MASEAGTAACEHDHQHEETEEEAEAALAAMAELAVGERQPLGEERQHWRAGERCPSLFLLGALPQDVEQDEIDGGGEEEEEEEEEVVVVEEMLDDQPCLVHPGVYVGAVDAAANSAALRAKGITSILTVATELPDAAAIAAAAAQATRSPSSSSTAAAAGGEGEFERLHVALSDAADANLLRHVPKCLSFIDGALADGGAVLIHCVAGRQRAPAIAAAYLMLRASRQARQRGRALALGGGGP